MNINNISKYNFFEIINSFHNNSSVESELLYGVISSDNVPMVSITIPTYRRLELLKDAVQSVLSQNNFDNFEIVIVDNDYTGEYSQRIIEYLIDLDDKRIFYYKNKHNIGVFANWNRCIELARGKWMTILCDDDILFSDYLCRMTQVIDNNPEISRVECKYLKFTNTNEIKLPIFQKLKRNLINCLWGNIKVITPQMYIADCFTGPHAQLYKTEYAKAIGGFNLKFAPSADYIFNALYVYTYPNVLQLNEYLCGYRILCNDGARKIIRTGCLKWYGRFSKFLLNLYPSILWNSYQRVYFMHYYCSTIVKNVFIRKSVALVSRLTEKLLLLMLNRAR